MRKRVTRAYVLRSTNQIVTLRHRTPDLGGLVEVFINDNYQMPAAVQRSVQELARPLHAVDLGANIGLFGLSLLSQQPNATITAVEPDSSNAAILHQTIAANGHCKTWSVIEACAGTRDGTVRFRSGHFLQSQIDDAGETVAVRDVFPILANADLIKIDIEGAEFDLLSDPRFMGLSARVLWLEFHPPHAEAELVSLVRRAGFWPGTIKRRDGCGEFWAVRSPAARAGSK